jgi:hypothetical protein
MSAHFQDPSCMHWWLPNDESYPPMIRQIRKFVEERTSEARDVPAENLRDIKTIFASMKLDDGKTASMKLDDGKTASMKLDDGKTASMKLDDGKTHIPVSRKGMMPQPQVAVASDRGWRTGGMMDESLVDVRGMGVEEAEHYSFLEYPEGNDFWGTE